MPTKMAARRAVRKVPPRSVGTEEFAGWGKEDFVLWLHEHYPELPARKGASWVFVLRFHLAAELLTGKEGAVEEFTVSGAYEGCIRDPGRRTGGLCW